MATGLRADVHALLHARAGTGETGSPYCGRIASACARRVDALVDIARSRIRYLANGCARGQAIGRGDGNPAFKPRQRDKRVAAFEQRQRMTFSADAFAAALSATNKPR